MADGNGTSEITLQFKLTWKTGTKHKKMERELKKSDMTLEALEGDKGRMRLNLNASHVSPVICDSESILFGCGSGKFKSTYSPPT